MKYRFGLYIRRLRRYLRRYLISRGNSDTTFIKSEIVIEIMKKSRALHGSFLFEIYDFSFREIRFSQIELLL